MFTSQRTQGTPGQGWALCCKGDCTPRGNRVSQEENAVRTLLKGLSLLGDFGQDQKKYVLFWIGCCQKVRAIQ